MSDTKEEETKEELGPKEFLTKIREKVGEGLKTPPDSNSAVLVYNVEQYIQIIRALLKSNQEIWDRCKEHSSCENDISEGWCTEFLRFGYMSIETSPYPPNKTKSAFFTYAVQEKKNFDTRPLSNLPSMLTTIFEPKTIDSKRLLDFQSFFEKSLVLHDDILGPFLAKLKAHLESVQVCLGNIEGWLVEPNETKGFIESTFGKTLNPCNAQECKHPECHPDKYKCANAKCEREKGDHSRSYSKDWKCNRADSYFHCWGCELVFEIKGPGKIQYSFNISDQKERERLKKCLEFVSQYD